MPLFHDSQNLSPLLLVPPAGTVVVVYLLVPLLLEPQLSDGRTGKSFDTFSPNFHPENIQDIFLFFSPQTIGFILPLSGSGFRLCCRSHKTKTMKSVFKGQLNLYCKVLLWNRTNLSFKGQLLTLVDVLHHIQNFTTCRRF